MAARNSFVFVLALGALAVGPSACGDDGGGGATADAATSAADALPGCERTAAAADRARKLVVSRPFAGSNMAKQYEVLDVATDGTITQPGVTFEMGRASDGRIAFTRDGEVGLIAQSDGTVGVFRFDQSGAPVVVHAGFDAGGAEGFWASSVVMGPQSRIAYVLNSQWRTNGGGVYSVAIGCDGSLTYLGLVAASKLPQGMSGLPDGRYAVAADDFLDAEVINGNAYLVDLGAGTAAGIDVFGDAEAIIGSAAATSDGRWFLIGDVSSFSTIGGNRVGVVEVTSSGLRAAQVIPNLEDPFDMVTSPFEHNTTLVVSGFGDGLYELTYSDSTPATPFSAAEVTYSGGAPQLPGSVAMIEQGSLKGYVFIAENQGVRRVRFIASGAVEDLGLTSFGSGSEHITGAIGIQP
jgi:hypothetical protein